MSAEATSQFKHDGVEDGSTGKAWKGGFSMRGVLQMQSLGDFIFAILVGIALIITYAVGTPSNRAIFMYDATISYPDSGTSTIPSWLCFVVPVGCMILTVIVVEVLLARPMATHRTWTSAVGAALYFVAAGAWSYVFDLFVNQVTNFMVGYPRPEFLARCQPQLTSTSIQLTIGQAATVNCTSTDTSHIEDGLKSFPSGHSSTSACMALYITVYLIWAMYIRPRRYCTTAKGQLLRDVLHAFSLAWMMAVWCWAWFVGATRITNNEHSPADVAAGWINGIVIGSVFAVRAVLACKIVHFREERSTAQTMPPAPVTLADERV